VGANDIRIVATGKRDGSEDISDWLYWFEENGVTDFDGNGHHDNYTFQIYVGGKLVYPVGDEPDRTDFEPETERDNPGPVDAGVAEISMESVARMVGYFGRPDRERGGD
jgi:hypothetical protein